MALSKKSPINIFFTGILLFLSCLNVSPSNAASALAAWSISSDGILRLRTSKGTDLKAFFQDGDKGKGDRVWVDFPGELIKPRRLSGNGPIKEIRLGKPFQGYTRLVIEFIPSVDLEPRNLRLIGVSEDRWELSFVGIPPIQFRTIGEGVVIQKGLKNSSKNTYIKSFSSTLDLKNLPSVPRSKFRVVIDPGHGGPDPGAVGINGLRETEVVLDISKQVAKLLTYKGVKVLLTRRSEIDLDLPPRVAKANRFNADAFVSIHANASRERRGDINGLETFYYTGYRGYSLAENIHHQITKFSPGSPDRGIRKARFFVIRRTSMPAALVEVGFVTGRNDAKLLGQREYRDKLSFAIAKGILMFLEGKS